MNDTYRNNIASVFTRVHAATWLATLLAALQFTAPCAIGAPPTVPVFVANGRAFTESVDLPGTSVIGFETAKLESKVGGYIKEITESKSAAGKIEEIDIGSYVTKGQVLAVLDAPELFDNLAEKKALILQSESDVIQADASILQAEAKVISAEAELEEAKTGLQEKQALLQLSQSDCDNQQKLYDNQATTRELLFKAQSHMEAASAALGTVNAKVRTAAALVKAAEANVLRAEADRKHALAGVEVAKATIRKAETMIGYTSIVAPFDGIVTKRMVDHGTFVRSAMSNSSAMPLFEVTRNDKVRLVARVPMSRAQRVRLGQQVIFHSVGGLAGATVAGEISRASAVLDKSSRMLEVHVYVDNPTTDSGYVKLNGKWIRRETKSQRELTLQPGMFGTATILESWDELAVIPTTAIGTNETGSTYVLLLETIDGKTFCRQRVVSVVFNDAADVGVSSGIQPGDRVVASNVDSYADGDEVIAGS